MTEATGTVSPWYRPIRARRPDEDHRSSTPLELLFDLCFVVAVAQAAAELHHAVAEDHVGTGVWGYVAVFFAIWWAWMNFSWFATAFDVDLHVTHVGDLVAALATTVPVPIHLTALVMVVLTGLLVATRPAAVIAD